MSDLNDLRWQILDAKEERWLKQKAFVNLYKSTLIVFKMNIPSWPKISTDILVVFHKSLEIFKENLTSSKIAFRLIEIQETLLGPEAFISTKMNANDIKDLAIHFEEYHNIGRFFDVDVIDNTGKMIERKIKRKCFLCSEQAIDCMRNQRHSPEEIKEYFDEKIANYLKS
ncbi:MAG: citrate lyase holo-[acyl-carrier protein] synthase [Asgard group archaeon]|nr:citrate lyase holo-[acyl-carrier protein] synthase [Asgard group archaeon]